MANRNSSNLSNTDLLRNVLINNKKIGKKDIASLLDIDLSADNDNIIIDEILLKLEQQNINDYRSLQNTKLREYNQSLLLNQREGCTNDVRITAIQNIEKLYKILNNNNVDTVIPTKSSSSSSLSPPSSSSSPSTVIPSADATALNSSESHNNNNINNDKEEEKVCNNKKGVVCRPLSIEIANNGSATIENDISEGNITTCTDDTANSKKDKSNSNSSDADRDRNRNLPVNYTSTPDLKQKTIPVKEETCSVLSSPTPQEPIVVPVKEMAIITTITPNNNSNNNNALNDNNNKNASVSRLPSWVIQFCGPITDSVFVVGALFNLLFRYYERNKLARTTTGIVSYFIGFILFSVSGIMELLIDVFNIRGECGNHGRYKSTNEKYLNISISIFFSLGAIMDIFAFYEWIQKNFVLENRIKFFTTHLWFLLSLTVMYMELFYYSHASSSSNNSNNQNNIDQSNQNENDIAYNSTVNSGSNNSNNEKGNNQPLVVITTLSDYLDTIGNTCFIVATFIDSVMQYLNGPEAPFENSSFFVDNDKHVKNFKFTSGLFFLANASFFWVADIIRLTKRKDTKKQSDNNSGSNDNMISTPKKDLYV